MLDVAAPVLTTVLSILTMAWLSRRSGQAPEMRDGLLQFRMARSYGILGWFIGGLAVFMAVGAVMEFTVSIPLALLFAVFALSSPHSPSCSCAKACITVLPATRRSWW